MSSRVLGCQATPSHPDLGRQIRREKVQKSRVTLDAMWVIWGELSSNHHFFNFFFHFYFILCVGIFFSEFVLVHHLCV